jgi:mRNA interferase RelE/StbE
LQLGFGLPADANRLHYIPFGSFLAHPDSSDSFPSGGNASPEDPPPRVKKLAGSETLYRIRVGDYRVGYEIQDTLLVVLVVEGGHRREIYPRRS